MFEFISFFNKYMKRDKLFPEFAVREDLILSLKSSVSLHLINERSHLSICIPANQCLTKLWKHLLPKLRGLWMTFFFIFSSGLWKSKWRSFHKNVNLSKPREAFQFGSKFQKFSDHKKPFLSNLNNLRKTTLADCVPLPIPNIRIDSALFNLY